MPLDFTAIDFETANSSPASACAVGLVRVRAGRVVAKAGWLIRPPTGYDEFNPFNTRIHGIRVEDVAGSAEWTHHNAGFDMNVLRRACAATGDDCPPYRYLCTLQLARKSYVLDSYRLPIAAAEAGFADFAHHNATADAEACAHIVIDTARRHGATDVSHLAELAGIKVGRLVPSAPAPVSAGPTFAPIALEAAVA